MCGGGFPTAAVTNHHRLCVLEKHKFVISWFWRSEVQSPCQQAEVKELGEWGSVPSEGWQEGQADLGGGGLLRRK